MDVVAEARSRLKALDAEAKELRSFLETADALARKFSPDPLDGITAETIIEELDKANETANIAQRILLGAGRPLKQGELYKMMCEQEYVVGGKNPVNTMSSRLSYSKRFQTIKGRGIWPRNSPLPQSVKETGLGISAQPQTQTPKGGDA